MASVDECFNCPYGGVKIGSRGPIDSPLVIIGDSPSALDKAKGQAFVGSEGRLIDQMLRSVGFDVEPLYLNAVSCFANDKTSKDITRVRKVDQVKVKFPGGKKKFASALQTCNNHLISEIKKHPRKMIIVLGTSPLHSITGDKKLKITKARGQLIPTELAELGLFVVVHPATMLVGGGSLKQYRLDFSNAKSIFNGIEVTKFKKVIPKTLKYGLEVLILINKLQKLGKGTLVAADIETSGLSFWKHRILEIGISTDGVHVDVIPQKMIRPELFQNDCDWVWHNGQFDIKFLWFMGCKEAKVHHDTLLLSYAQSEIGGVHNLEQVGWDWLRAPNYKDMLKPYLPNRDTSYEVIPTEIRHKYASLDVGVTWQLFAPLMNALKRDKALVKNYFKLLIPATNYLARVETNGFLVDKDWVLEQKEVMESEKDECMKLFQDMAIESYGKTVNVNSPKQLKEYLYGHLKLSHPDQSTGKAILEELPKHPCLEPLLRLRKLQKSLSTYIMPFLEKSDPDGRIHATYKLYGTLTGRLSSSEPNMQNVTRTPEIRGCLKATPGNILIECDLSQAELRSLAELSGDAALIKIFQENKISLHDEVSAEIFEDYLNPKTSPRAKSEMKMRGKAVNFGIVYGRQAFSFMAEFDIVFEEAQRWITKWLERFPSAAQYIADCRGAVSKGQSLRTVFGRKRRLGVITPERRTKIENECANFPHQSTASDITLAAGIIVEPILRLKYNAKIVNTVHDCIIVDAPPEHKDAICKLVTETLQQVPRDWGLKIVPFISSSEVGTRWGHLTEYDGFKQKEAA